jgi:hypothetical protein
VRARSVLAHADQVAKDALVLRGHHIGGETGLEFPPAALARDVLDILDRLHEVVELAGDDAADAIAQDLRHRAARPRYYWRAAGERLDHRKAERLRPINREHQGECIAQEIILLRFVDLADVFDPGQGQARLDDLLEIGAAGDVNLGRELIGMPALLARSGRFSGEMRPRKARYFPGPLW